VRKHIEDAILLCEPADPAVSTPLGQLYLLADGAGGHAAGEVASRLAVETIASAYYDQTVTHPTVEHEARNQSVIQHLHGHLQDLDIPLLRIQRAFSAAHTRIRAMASAREEYAGMITTCMAAVVKGTQLLVVHVGDSRAYMIRPSAGNVPAITCLTTDHSMVAELARAGIISPQQMQTSSSRHIILRALGENKRAGPYPDRVTCILQPGDRLVLCCDGLWSMLSEEQIARVVSRNTPQVACDELIRLEERTTSVP
jgi:protein phosphatase